MKLINRIMNLYRQYRRVMWLIGTLTALGAPLGGYGLHLLAAFKHKLMLLQGDNPELANSLPTVDLWSWLTDAGGMFGRACGVVALFAVLYVVTLIGLQVGSLILRAATASATDGTTSEGEAAPPSEQSEYSASEYEPDDYGFSE